MSNKKIYVVTCSSGSYDDFHKWVSGITDDPFKAEETKQKILTNVQIALDFDIDEFYRILDNENELATDEMCKLSEKYYNAKEFNNCEVIEYNLNEFHLDIYDKKGFEKFQMAMDEISNNK